MLTNAQRNEFYTICNETHIMIGGTTGSGKSTLIHDLITCLTSYGVQEQKLVLIDLKRIELRQWRKYPHTIMTVTEPSQVLKCLDIVIQKMEERYKDMERHDTTVCNKCYITVIIDELAEVLRVKGAEERIDTLLRLARAANIQLIMATQNPSRSSGIPARLWQNVTCTIGLRCKSATESRQVIGVSGCELLPRYGKAYVQDANGLRMIDIPKASKEDFNGLSDVGYGVCINY